MPTHVRTSCTLSLVLVVFLVTQTQNNKGTSLANCAAGLVEINSVLHTTWKPNVMVTAYKWKHSIAANCPVVGVKFCEV